MANPRPPALAPHNGGLRGIADGRLPPTLPVNATAGPSETQPAAEELLFSLRALLTLPHEERFAVLDDDPTLRSMPAWSLLMAEVRAEEETPASERADAAALALAIADRLDPAIHDPRLVKDAWALAASALADCRRDAGRGREADTLLARAEQAAMAGTGDPYIFGEILLSRAQIALAEERPARGCAFLDAALDLFQRCGDTTMEGVILIQKAAALHSLRRDEEAREALARGVALLEALARNEDEDEDKDESACYPA